MVRIRPMFQSTLLVVAAWCAPATLVTAQHRCLLPQAQAQQAGTGILRGRVLDPLGKPVSGALVRLATQGAAAVAETVTDPSGSFAFPSLRMGGYTVTAEKSGVRSLAALVVLRDRGPQSIDLALGSAQQGSANQAIEFSDTPSFTVAGVTDWTAVGGHGSDATLRTSEDLARETVALRAEGMEAQATPAALASERELRSALAAAPRSYAANHELGQYYLREAKYREAIALLQEAVKIHPAQPDDEFALALACQGVGDLKQAREHVGAALAQRDVADWHRLAGELDEKLGDPLAAVRHQERAAQLDPSEENYLAWGSELLLHRAVWEAVEVFKRGSAAHPASARLLTGWGAALFAGALYDQAATRLCEASDLNPGATEPYLFMGKIELAAPAPLPCVEQKLARFVQAQPGNALANYFYAMAIFKRGDQTDRQRVEALLEQADALDPKLAAAPLQLGIMAAAQRDYAKAIGFYTKAIDADPSLQEAHYRLGVAYDRTGEQAKSRQEFQLHEELAKKQADAVEQQRRDVKQFLVVLQGQQSKSTSP